MTLVARVASTRLSRAMGDAARDADDHFTVFNAANIDHWFTRWWPEPRLLLGEDDKRPEALITGLSVTSKQFAARGCAKSVASHRWAYREKWGRGSPRAPGVRHFPPPGRHTERANSAALNTERYLLRNRRTRHHVNCRYGEPLICG